MTASTGPKEAEKEWFVGQPAVEVFVSRVGPTYLAGVEFSLRVCGEWVRASWEYPDADLADVTKRLMSRWVSGSE